MEVVIIKIDRSFVTGVPNAIENVPITSAMINAHDLNIKVVCEGVETEEELQYIMDKCSDELQG
ncbi:EAL domain-containing protein [Metabacillus halosaccharovorans]|uniref:EAL domain-containing protein n=1 Tax=Metabacillus halosaccharovorans TaxID=930124 RepID=UPI0009951B05